MSNNSTNITSKNYDNKEVRFDLIFSYWIFIWSILYILGVPLYSPKFALICGLSVNIVMFMYLYHKNILRTKLIYFVLINTIIKVLPLIYLRNKNIKKPDIYFTIILFLVFIIWLQINNQYTSDNINNILDLYLDDNKLSPSMIRLNAIKKYLLSC